MGFGAAERGLPVGDHTPTKLQYDQVEAADVKKIAYDLTEIVRRDAKTDWNVKEVRAKLRQTIKRLLLRYGYPPHQEASATDLILRQAEVMVEAG